MEKKFFYVKLNDSAIIGSDMMIASFPDIFTSFGPEPFETAEEAAEIAEEYDGKVIRIIAKEVW